MSNLIPHEYLVRNHKSLPHTDNEEQLVHSQTWSLVRLQQQVITLSGREIGPTDRRGKASLECRLCNHHLGTLWARLSNDLPGGLVHSLGRATLYPAFQEIHTVRFARTLLSFEALQRHLFRVHVEGLT